MNRLRWPFFSALFWALAQPVAAELPELYRSVDRLTWVVQDLESALKGWRALGLNDIQEHGEIEIAATKNGDRPTLLRLRAATARIGSVEIDWVQPTNGENPLSDFMGRKGSGVFSLLYRTSSLEEMNVELERMRDLGVGVLLDATIGTETEFTRFAYLDTETEGKYVLGLVHSTEPSSQRTARGNLPPFDAGISQFAFVIRDPEPVSRYWRKLGFPEIDVTHGPVRDRRYRGEPGQFDHKLGWQRHTGIDFEWCIPLEGPNAYDDHLEKYGEGFHHLAFFVDDMDAAVAAWETKGIAELQSGAWGEEDRPGSGRFAYMDTYSLGGITIEFLWSFR